MWNKAYGLETANSEGDSPAFHWGECVRPQHLTQTKCEQICARKREITPAHSKPLALRWCQTQRILHSHARKETEWCMYGEREVEEVGRGERKKKRKSKKNIWQVDLQLWWNVSNAARAGAAAVSVLNRRPDSAGRVAGGGLELGGGGHKMALWLLLSSLNKQIKIPLKEG